MAFRSFGLRFLHETPVMDQPAYRYSHELQVVVCDSPRTHVVLAGTSSGGTDGPTGDEEMDFHQPDDESP